jgi:hypothetical protein
MSPKKTQSEKKEGKGNEKYLFIHLVPSFLL